MNKSNELSLSEFLDIANQDYDDLDAKASVLLPLIQRSIIGIDSAFVSPFGPRKIVYCDYFASGKSLSFIEDYIRLQVLPYYANTHTEVTETGSRTGFLREEARRVIKEIVHGSPDLGPDRECSVLFTGHGSTSAINKLVHMLRLKDSKYWLDISNSVQKSKKFKWNLFKRTKEKSVSDQNSLPESKRPVVFISIQEHHANIIPWRRDTVADVVVIPDENGSVSLSILEKELKKYNDRPLKIGSFTAGSNITGALNNLDKISILLHKYGALSCFDYAGVGSYVPIDMNSGMGANNDMALAYKDFVFLSPHKFLGGPGTPGILVARCKTLRALTGGESYSPNQVGGGIVTFVSKQQEHFSSDLEAREEAGTQAIVETIRCGAVFLVKEAIGPILIQKLEFEHLHHVKSRLCKHPEIKILGTMDIPRIPVISFLIMNPEFVKQKKAPFYHFNFISAVLNDIFGIQARGGCMCAAVYTAELMGIPDDQFKEYEDVIVRNSLFSKKGRDKSCSDGVCHGSQGYMFHALKPGFTRLSFNYFLPLEEVDFIVDAIIWLSKNAQKLLPLYELDPESGQWFSKAWSDGKVKKCRSFHTLTNSLYSIYSEGASRNTRDLKCPNFKECFELADGILETIDQIKTKFKHNQAQLAFKSDPKVQALKWFITNE